MYEHEAHVSVRTYVHTHTHTPAAVPQTPAAPRLLLHMISTKQSSGDTHFLADVNPAEAEGAEVGVGTLHRRLDGLPK